MILTLTTSRSLTAVPNGEPNATDEHIYIPDIYKALGNPK